MQQTLSNKRVKIIECPRDAMQGLDQFVPTQLKADYINALLKVGFHTIDCGSFVSPKAIPQMRDTAEVLSKLDDKGDTKLSVIVANEQGILSASKYKQIDYLGYPFSVSENFQRRNTNKSMKESLTVVRKLKEIADRSDKEVVIYISMGFGNPYGELWDADIVVDWVSKIADFGIHSFSLSDTVGVSTADNITEVFTKLSNAHENLDFGAHFHTLPDNWLEKVTAAWESGCKRFDGAISGFGGCPMAADDLVGNMPTEHLMEFFEDKDISTGLDFEAFADAREIAEGIFK